MERPEFEGKEGSKVIVEGMGAGTLMFYGLHHKKSSPRCGVELDEANGKNNGTVGGHTYFTCEDKHGCLVDPGKVELVEAGNEKKEKKKKKKSKKVKTPAPEAAPEPEPEPGPEPEPEPEPVPEPKKLPKKKASQKKKKEPEPPKKAPGKLGGADFLQKDAAAPKKAEISVGKLKPMASWSDNLQPEPLAAAADKGFAEAPKVTRRLSSQALAFESNIKKELKGFKKEVKAAQKERITEISELAIPDLEKLKKKVISPKKRVLGKSQNDIRLEAEAKEQAKIDKAAAKVAAAEKKALRAAEQAAGKQAKLDAKAKAEADKKAAKEAKVKAEYEAAHNAMEDDIGFSGLQLKKTSTGFNTLARSATKKGAHPMIQAAQSLWEDDE